MSFNNFIKYLFVVPVIGYCMICTGYATQHIFTHTDNTYAYNYSDNELHTFGFRTTDNDSGRGSWLKVGERQYLHCDEITKDWLVLAPNGAQVRYKVKDIAGNEDFLDAVSDLVGDDATWENEPDELTDDDKLEYVIGGTTVGAGALAIYLSGKVVGTKAVMAGMAGGGGLGVLAGIGLIVYGVLDEVVQDEHALTIESNGGLVLKCSNNLWVPDTSIDTIDTKSSCPSPGKTVRNTFTTSGEADDTHMFDPSITLYYPGDDYTAPFKQICVCAQCQTTDDCDKCNNQCQHYAPDYQVHTGWKLTEKCSKHENYKKSDQQGNTELVLKAPQRTALGNHLNVKKDAQCDYECMREGWKITPNSNYYCDPTQQPEIIDSEDGFKYTFKCVDTEETIAQKRADEDTCATEICGASGGLYTNGQCKCGNYVCTTEFDDTSYKYCGGVEGKLGTRFCVNNVLKLGLPENHPCYNQDSAKECYLGLVREAYKKTPECATDATSNATASNDAESISELAKTLDAIEDAYGLSKWRTVDGKFNYARLASDATAAVVLGTTGALVTSSVVKKKQVEAGFESLECTVGGQHVGDWGDVFRIDGK